MKIGDKIKDNDPRVGDRILEITGFEDGKFGEKRVLAKTPFGATVKIMMRRIHTDGKPRRSGFDLVEE